MNINQQRYSNDIAIDGQQSLLTAINRFVEAVDTMDDTVMIPCRLRDMPTDTLPTALEENNNKALVSTTMPTGDLYHFYAMLQAIRSEITAGPKSEEEEICDNDSDEISNSIEKDPIHNSARKTASSFRFHLRGLFGVLNQMTETAKFLSTKYEKEVTSAQSGVSSVSSFRI